MGQLILCGGEPAAVPYHMESTSVNIYSLEEMSYYLVHNTDYLDADFMCREFCEWVSRELREEELAKRLLSCLEGEKALHEFVKTLLDFTGYADKEEIRETEELLVQFETKDELEQRKIRGDRLLRQKRYRMAMEEYGWILRNVKKNTPVEFQGNVCHNLGTAYAGNFLFVQAAEYFHEAYRKNTNPESLKEEIFALILSGQEELKNQRAEEYELGEEVLREYELELDRIHRDSEKSTSEEKGTRLHGSPEKKTGDAKKKELLGQMEQWKQEYRAYGR